MEKSEAAGLRPLSLRVDEGKAENPRGGERELGPLGPKSARLLACLLAWG